MRQLVKLIRNECFRQIHFHEVGAIDSIVDTVGSVLAMDLLGVREIHSSFVPFSSGRVKCMHGVLPVPPPATFRLMIGVPVCQAPPGCVYAFCSRMLCVH